MFRVSIPDRLIGTKVYLDESYTTLCGTITSVSKTLTVTAQTYTVSCPTTSTPTFSVMLFDDVMDTSYDDKESKMIMSVTEVMVYGSHIPSKGSYWLLHRQEQGIGTL